MHICVLPDSKMATERHINCNLAEREMSNFMSYDDLCRIGSNEYLMEAAVRNLICVSPMQWGLNEASRAGCMINPPEVNLRAVQTTSFVPFGLQLGSGIGVTNTE